MNYEKSTFVIFHAKNTPFLTTKTAPYLQNLVISCPLSPSISLPQTEKYLVGELDELGELRKIKFDDFPLQKYPIFDHKNNTIAAGVDYFLTKFLLNYTPPDTQIFGGWIRWIRWIRWITKIDNWRFFTPKIPHFWPRKQHHSCRTWLFPDQISTQQHSSGQRNIWRMN